MAETTEIPPCFSWISRPSSPGYPCTMIPVPTSRSPFNSPFTGKEQAESATVTHSAFLGTPENDPREEFLIQLIGATKGKGSVLVYNKAFEGARLRELQDLFPDVRAGSIISWIASLTSWSLSRRNGTIPRQ